MTNYIKHIFAPTVLLCLFVFGCEENETATSPEAKPQAQKVATKPDNSANKITTEEAPAAPPKYVYDSTGRRDPFIPLIATKKQAPTANGNIELIPLEPLQKYDIDQLRLIGVVMVKPQPIAMVAAPDGKSYILKKGVKVGRNNGYVIGITIDAVIIKEQYVDIGGDIRTATVEIKLPKKEGV